MLVPVQNPRAKPTPSFVHLCNPKASLLVLPFYVYRAKPWVLDTVFLQYAQSNRWKCVASAESGIYADKKQNVSMPTVGCGRVQETSY